MKTVQDYKDAIVELERAFKYSAEFIVDVQKVELDITSEPMDSYKRLQKHFDDHHALLLSDVGCETSIYSKAGNMNFRAWHDFTHVTHRRGFDTDSELYVIDLQYNTLKNRGYVSDDALFIFKADTEGQVKYYDLHKEFVKDQERFINLCLNVGIDRAVKLKQ